MSRFQQVKQLTRTANVQAVKVNALGIQRRFITSGVSVKSIHNDFRYSGTEKNAGALQDLLRRVMEIDADITNTPIVEFKPNTQQCVAYNINDTLDLTKIYSTISNQEDFKIQKKYDNMLHILDSTHGGDIHLFDNGSLVYWGVNPSRQSVFIDLIQGKKDINEYNTTNERVEYTIDEDEVTDIKGDIIILNPYLPSIELSKVAFSYGFGRVAKLNSLERTLDNYLNDFFDNYSEKNKKDLFKELLSIHKRLISSSRDGFLGTPDLHWAKPELEEYANKVSKRFDVQTRISVLTKKLDHARQLISMASDLNMFHE